MAERQTIKKLVCDGLGYCCLWSFFSLFKKTSTIAIRLGVTDRAVRYHRQAFRRGELCCEGKKNCLKGKLV